MGLASGQLRKLGYDCIGKVIERTNPKDGAAMVYIPEGEFIMGTDQAEIDEIWQKFGWDEWQKLYAKNESPKHRVYLDGFWMYKHEVILHFVQDRPIPQILQ